MIDRFFMIRCFLLFLAVFLAGCSSLGYIEPTSGEVARLRIVNATNDQVIVFGYETIDCKGETRWMTLLNGYLVNSTPKSLGMPMWGFHKNGAKEIYVSTAKPLRLMLKGYNGNQTCAVPVNLKLGEKDYELAFSYEKMDGCLVDFYKIRKNENGFVRELNSQFSNHVSEKNGNCMKPFKQLRW